MISETLNITEQQQVDSIMSKLGVEVTEADRRAASDDLKMDLDTNYELYENSNIVAKPKYVEKEEQLLNLKMKGYNITYDTIPMKDDVYVKIIKPTNGKIITNSISDMFSNYGKIVNLGFSDADYNINDNVYIDLKYVRCRFNINNETIAVVDKKGILGIE